MQKLKEYIGFEKKCKRLVNHDFQKEAKLNLQKVGPNDVAIV